MVSSEGGSKLAVGSGGESGEIDLASEILEYAGVMLVFNSVSLKLDVEVGQQLSGAGANSGEEGVG